MKRKPSAVEPEKSGNTRVLVTFLIIALIAGVLTVWRAGTNSISAQELAPGSTTVTFGNSSAITINDNSTASPYPSTINVSGVNPAYMTSVRVSISGLTHSYPDDLDIILVGPQGQRSILMSDAGGGGDVTALAALGFEQSAATAIADETTLTAGIFRPANYDASGTDTFPAPGPGALVNAPADLSVFNGTDPNGTWSLYVVDDANQDAGLISGGWQLRFTVPTVFTVNSAADPGDGTCDATCTLRDAIIAANASATGSDLIAFSSNFNIPQTINLQTALPDITKAVTINGPGANLLTVRRSFNAATDFRIFTITGGITNGVAISGMAISNGRVSDLGGGISSFSSLTLTNLHVTGNSATGSGGGLILAFADGVFTNCTFSGNTTPGIGGAIYFLGDGGHTLRIADSTISGNFASQGGSILNGNGSASNSRLEVSNSTITNNSAINNVTSAGIFNVATIAGGSITATIRNSIIAGNAGFNLRIQAAAGSTATFQTLGFNLSDNFGNFFTPLATDITSATPRLAPLANYGGQTPTHALLHASPAINAGDASNATTDQRGVPRVFGAQADIGAVEVRPLVVTSTANGGAGSLRNILGGGGNATLTDIQFDNSLFSTPQTITLTGGQLAINYNANIIAPGPELVTISGNNADRVFNVPNTNTASLSGMTMSQGGVGGDNGGCILNQGSLSITNSTLSNCLSVFEGGGIYNTGSLMVGGSTISAGLASGSGGAVYSTSSGTVTIANSTISGNRATNGITGIGGGIDSRGSLTVLNSTISGNIADNAESQSSCGGGIYSSGTLTVVNSTVTGNSVLQTTGGTQAGGILRAGGAATIRNSIVGANVNNGTVADVNAVGAAGFTSSGFNLIGNRGNVTFGATGDQSGTGGSPVNPLLGPLQYNGGTTSTHALLFGSPALERGNGSGATSDQRGAIRPIDLAGITNISDGSDIGAFEAQTAPVAQNRAPFDYDGDNKTDLSIFRPGPGEWWALRSSNGSNFALQFGNSTDKLVPADYTGDGKTDVAFWRPSNGNWFILRSEDFSFFAFPFGTTGDVPVPADYDGDGKADAAVYRESSLTWFISRSSGGTDIIGFGAAGDKPVVADYDGDAKADIAIFRPNGASGPAASEWWVRRSSNASVLALQFGSSTDKAVQGDFTGDGKADVAFWRPSNGNWFVLRSENFSFFAFPFGANGDVPVPGDYDADGKIDAGVFRPSNQNWFIQRSTAGTLIQAFGIAGDIPTPSAYIP